MAQPARIEILNGWKEIANYLGKGVRTVQRYEREQHLPVRRPAGKSFAAVIATKGELDSWVEASPLRELVRLPKPGNTDAVMRDLKRNFAELLRLRKQSVALQESLVHSLDDLRINLRVCSPLEIEYRDPLVPPEMKTTADMLRLDSGKQKAN
jgi:hypothetical protein